jgi:hypothetical protein
MRAGRYAHEVSPNVFQLFLANVLLGYVKDYGVQKAEELSRPPDRLPNVPFDSVQGGPHKGWFRSDDAATIMRVIYSNAQAYPAYLISFSKSVI